MALRLYNTATHLLEIFAPLHPPLVTMYNCGPTVYNYQHIGNMRSAVFADIIRRTLEREGYRLEQIINITDVGHLVADSDDGEDKMEIAVKRENKGVEDLIAMYTGAYVADLKSLLVKKAFEYPDGFPRATKHIPEQIAIIQTLEEKGYTYRTSDGIYFDTSKFPNYALFAKLDIDGMRGGTRVNLGEKKNITDFALWKFFSKEGEKREQEWESPWGKGFPGWHVECSAMAIKYLGETIDIHTGGIDHIPIHHTNEIAQSECATGKQFARFWMHNAFVTVDGEKMSKSLGNTYRLIDLHERGIPPLAYRYWLLTAHYRTQVNFTWEAVAGAQSAYNRLTNFVLNLGEAKDGTPLNAYLNEFAALIEEDMNTAGAIALIWKLTKDADATPADKYATLMNIDEVLGLGLSALHVNKKLEEIPEAVAKLMEERKNARAQKDFSTSDRLRVEIEGLGYDVKDTSSGQKIEPI